VEIQPKPPTAKGPAEWFTGNVFIDGIVRGEEPSHVYREHLERLTGC